MFSNAKVGDKVWSFTKGWGTIIDTQYSTEYPIRVQYSKNRTDHYTICGRFCNNDTNQSIFWDEIKFDVPKKTLPKLEVDTKVVVWHQDSSAKYKRYFHSFSDDGCIRVWGVGCTSYSACDEDDFSKWTNWELYEDSNNV